MKLFSSRQNCGQIAKIKTLLHEIDASKKMVDQILYRK